MSEINIWQPWNDGFYFRNAREEGVEIVRFVPQWRDASDEDKDRFFVDVIFENYTSDTILACVEQRYGFTNSDQAQVYLRKLDTNTMLISVAAALYEFIEEGEVSISQTISLGLD